MEENNNFIIISSYDEQVRYFKEVIDSKECRVPIFYRKRRKWQIFHFKNEDKW